LSPARVDQLAKAKAALRSPVDSTYGGGRSLSIRAQGVSTFCSQLVNSKRRIDANFPDFCRAK
jgi:hypothetical protein